MIVLYRPSSTRHGSEFEITCNYCDQSFLVVRLDLGSMSLEVSGLRGEGLQKWWRCNNHGQPPHPPRGRWFSAVRTHHHDRPVPRKPFDGTDENT